MSFVYDDALPITAWRDEIAQAISDHQVLIVAGETGSGKTTQLPKICLELGRRSIGHTQPRRIAARTVAERIAEELERRARRSVGYQVRFTRKASGATRLKVMTDGVLLAEIGHDRDLRRYDTIIIDEAHERSLNIDFLLGYLRQLLPGGPSSRSSSPRPPSTPNGSRRTSPLTTARRADHRGVRAAPIRSRCATARCSRDGEADQIGGDHRRGQGAGRGRRRRHPGLPLRRTGDPRRRRGARPDCSCAAPRYFRCTPGCPPPISTGSSQPHTGRRIVLATNVAETSLTVPGIRYVVDAGTARISRYPPGPRSSGCRSSRSPRPRPTSGPGAAVGWRPGVCIRLYSEEDFAGRPEFTEPEILRTNLASVILQMSAADLGEIGSFPFVEAPDGTQITDGLRLLTELGALSEKGTRERPRLTAVGRRLAAIPVDPRMGRMLLAAEDQGCLREMLIIVAGLSIQDPRERPPEQRDKADALHRRFWSDAGLRPSTGSGNVAEGQGSECFDRLSTRTFGP